MTLLEALPPDPMGLGGGHNSALLSILKQDKSYEQVSWRLPIAYCINPSFCLTSESRDPPPSLLPPPEFSVPQDTAPFPGQPLCFAPMSMSTPALLSGLGQGATTQPQPP